MSTLTNEKTGAATGSASGNRLFAVVAILAIVVGLGSVLGGLGGMVYTWQSAAVENINTPSDAVIAETPVRGPFTMWAQADIITKHQLNRTDGLRYAEMPGVSRSSMRPATRSSARTAAGPRPERGPRELDQRHVADHGAEHGHHGLHAEPVRDRHGCDGRGPGMGGPPAEQVSGARLS
jgi:hypothetical protein